MAAADRSPTRLGSLQIDNAEAFPFGAASRHRRIGTGQNQQAAVAELVLQLLIINPPQEVHPGGQSPGVGLLLKGGPVVPIADHLPAEVGGEVPPLAQDLQGGQHDAMTLVALLPHHPAHREQDRRRR